MGLKRIPLDRIISNPNQPRPPEEFDEASLWELAASIREEGLKQPITVRPFEGGYQLVMGERRWRASCILHDEGHLPDGTILAHVRQPSVGWQTRCARSGCRTRENGVNGLRICPSWLQ
jgi:ParB-like nuclease domain